MTALFCFGNGIAQNKIGQEVQKLQQEHTAFTAINLLTTDSSISKRDIDQAVTDATVARVNLNTLSQITTNPSDFVELDIPYQNQHFKILLYRVNPFSNGFSIHTDRATNISFQKGIYYRGIIKGNPTSIAAFNFFNGEFNGIFSSQELGNVVVGKIDKPNNQSDYIVYSDANFLKQNNFQCHLKEDNTPIPTSTLNRDATSVKCVTFYFEIDYNLFVSNSSSTATTANWATSIFNNVQTLYANDGITTSLNSVYIWTNPDVYEGVGTSSLDYLQSFANNRPFISSDVGMLIGIDPGGLGGVAYLNGLCSNYNYGYSDVDGISIVTVPTYSWTTEVMTHELGHLMGSPHTHACAWNGNNSPIDGCGAEAGYPESGCTTIGPIPSTSVKGTIMSYCHLIQGVGISFANGFGVQPANLIANTVNSKTCLSTDCTNCNNTVTDIEANAISDTAATLSWEDFDNADSWEISVRPYSALPIWNTVTQTTYQASGLLPNTYYKVRIRPICTTTTPKIREFIFVTSGNYCGGLNFYDTGGAVGNYANRESFTRTITPNVPDQKLVVTFTQFSLEAGYDYLYIYNGADDSFPELNGGVGFTGTSSPGTVTSTATDGSLTFKFISDQGVTAAGWKATISCQQSLGIQTEDYLDFSYYPNPTSSSVMLKANTNITEIEVFNIQGRKLFAQKVDTLESSVDMSAFASGTYFFKVKFNDFEKNFKILKL
ncbi:M12 family metallo-peptidase [Flavobacterium antarcticum]|uniref:M12 family metallo-peptidase n=1 Tax=Flavobacterium antarcticum TaxID=271155 RepID=UPI0004131691|nr:M12 family metallo-peptidase [Flavobacterium antarcticum]